MKKTLLFFVTIIFVVMSVAPVYADAIDISTINTSTNSVRIAGSVKNKETTALLDNMIPDSGFNNGIGEWKNYTNTVTVSQFEESDGNKCLAATQRTAFNSGVQLQLADYFNQNGLGIYKLSFRMRADDTDYIKKANVSMVVMPQGGSNPKKIVKTLSNVSGGWTTYEFTIDVDSFGTDSAGNPLTVCNKGDFNAWGSDGIIYIIGQSTKFYTNEAKTEYVQDFRNYYFDDFSLQYLADLSGKQDSNEPFNCSYTVSEGSKVLKSGAFVSKPDGSYDFYTPVNGIENYDNVSVNVKCDDMKVNKTAAFNPKNNEPDFSLSYENKKLKVGINPYDYIDTNGISGATLVAGLYSDNNKLLDISVKDIVLNNSNELQSVYLDKPAENSGCVKLFCMNSLGKLIPLAQKKVKDIEKLTPNVYLIGDSICAKYDERQWPKQGWGELLPNYFDDKVTFVNCAGVTLSTKSYISPTSKNNWKLASDPLATWEQIKAMLNPGDFVVVALGINDTVENPEDPDSRGTTEQEYIENIKKFANETHASGADIIFVTSTLHGGIKNEATFLNSNTKLYSERSKVLMKTVDEIGATYIDLGKYQLDYYNTMVEKLGGTAESYDKVRDYFHIPNGYGYPNVLSTGADYLHYSINGANKLAQFISYLIKNSNSNLAKYIKDFDITYEFENIQDDYKEQIASNHTAYLVSDSICSYRDESFWPLQGWGTVISNYFNENITFVNCAGSGLSTKSFLEPTSKNNWKAPYTNGTWEKIKSSVAKGDYVIIALGINDVVAQNPEDPDSVGTTEEAYSKYLKQFTDETREIGANILFVTMTLNGGKRGENTFENDNTLLYRSRADVMKKVAEELGVTCIDLGKYQLDYYNAMVEKLGGDTEAYNTVRDYFHLPDGYGYPTKKTGSADYLHYSTNGITKISQFIAQLIKQSDSSLAKYVNNFEITYELENIQGDKPAE